MDDNQRRTTASGYAIRTENGLPYSRRSDEDAALVRQDCFCCKVLRWRKPAAEAVVGLISDIALICDF
jgi:hypothetical protein